MQIKDRMLWIEACLRYLGYLPKKKLMEHFGISPALMSSDLRRFVESERAGDGTLEISAGKITGELPTGDLAPLPHPADILAATEKSSFSSIDRMLRMRPDPEILAALFQAHKERHVLRVEYTSLSSGAQERLISVNHFVEAAGRLHIRVYDHDKNAYRDFVVARLVRIIGVEPHLSAVDALGDVDFGTLVQVTLMPNGNLSQDRRAAVCRDYGLDLEKGRTRTIRKSELFYLQAEYGETSEGWEPPVVISGVQEFPR